MGQATSYHPTPSALFYGETGLGAVPYFAPCYWIFHNPVLAINVTFIGSLCLTAVAFHWVVHRWTMSHIAGLVAAMTFLFTRWVLWGWVSQCRRLGRCPGAPLDNILASSRESLS